MRSLEAEPLSRRMSASSRFACRCSRTWQRRWWDWEGAIGEERLGLRWGGSGWSTEMPEVSLWKAREEEAGTREPALNGGGDCGGGAFVVCHGIKRGTSRRATLSFCCLRRWPTEDSCRSASSSRDPASDRSWLSNART